MKRNLFRIFVAFAAFFFAAQPADAQFGNILKKVTKTLDTVSKKDAKIKRTDPAASKDMPPQFVGTTTTSESGATVINPFAKDVDIQLVGAYGKSTSENYGTVTLVLKVKMIADKSRIGLGGVGDFPNSDLRSVTMFVDQDGESYTPDGGTTSDSFDVSEGVYVKLKLDGTYTRFENVNKTAKVMQVLKLGLYVDAAIRGYITMKNVPIQWDVEP